MKLLKQVNELEQNIANCTKQNLEVSQSTIGWQIEHALRAIIGICKALQSSDPSAYRKAKFKLDTWVVMTFRWIPRGKGKTPKEVEPKGEASVNELQKLIELASSEVSKLDVLNTAANFNHGLFGMMNKMKSIRFMEIHTNHHLKIIRDINK